ncbi:hypothetical protein CAY99_34980 [Pseudomonas aeruginosa]|nr:hypothetical protein CAY99_34980 [Pseudomonas aeruginosa]
MVSELCIRARSSRSRAAGETPPALDLDDSAGGGSRLGLSLRETPGSVSVANRASRPLKHIVHCPRTKEGAYRERPA